MDVGSRLLNAEVGVVWTCGPVMAVRGDCEPTGTNVDGGWHCEFATGLEVAVMVVGGDCKPTGTNVDGGWHCEFATGLEVAVMVVGGDCEPTGTIVDGFTVDGGWHCEFATGLEVADFGVRIFIPSVSEVDG